VRRLVFFAAIAAIAVSAHAEERRKVSPLAIYGTWLGTQGTYPTDCKGDGFVITFGAVNDKAFRMTLVQRTGGVGGTAFVNDYKVVEPPAGAPVRLEIFLAGEKGDLGIDQTAGSMLEIVPAGADHSYSTTNLYLRRCALN